MPKELTFRQVEVDAHAKKHPANELLYHNIKDHAHSLNK